MTYLVMTSMREWSPVAALFVVGVGYGRLVRRIAERRQQRLAEAVQRAEERLSGIRTVRTFNAESRELKGLSLGFLMVFVHVLEMGMG